MAMNTHDLTITIIKNVYLLGNVHHELKQGASQLPVSVM
jgi:hypothetical protein